MDGWDAAEFPELSAEQLTALIAAHGLDVSLADVYALPLAGVVNTALALGDRLVLRVAKPMSAAIADCRTEAVAVPAVTAAGVRTPRLVALDDSRSIVDGPFTIYERVVGQNFGLIDADVGDPASWSTVYREIGRELAVLHHNVADVPDPMGWLDEPGRVSVDEAATLVEQLARSGHLTHAHVRWLTRVMDRLVPTASGGARWRRFLHNDLGPTNVLVNGGRLAALIDWGDAGWGDPALDFAYLPLRAVPAALAGYRDVAPLDGDEEAEGRILWDHLAIGLLHLDRQVHAGRFNWDHPPVARFIELAAAGPFFAGWLT
jgi:aminoglycoside phosphotransferase (APT) family kinase protein